MMSVGLHLRMSGHPGRAAGLERFLDHVASTRMSGSAGATTSRGTGGNASAAGRLISTTISTRKEIPHETETPRDWQSWLAAGCRHAARGARLRKPTIRQRQAAGGRHPTSASRRGWCAARTARKGFGADLINEIAQAARPPGRRDRRHQFLGPVRCAVRQAHRIHRQPAEHHGRAVPSACSIPSRSSPPATASSSAPRDEMTGLRGSQGQVRRRQPRHDLGHLGDRQCREIRLRGPALRRIPRHGAGRLTRRAFTALNEIPTTVYAASQNKAIKVGFKDFNGRNFGYAFRLEEQGVSRQGRGGHRMHEDGRHACASCTRNGMAQRPMRARPSTTVYFGYGAPGLQGLRAHAARPRLQMMHACLTRSGAARGLGRHEPHPTRLAEPDGPDRRHTTSMQSHRRRLPGRARGFRTYGHRHRCW